jgi:DNA-binding transcriptional regulator YiaG
MVRVPTHREPTHPGEMLREEFLRPLGLSQRDLAARIDVSYQRVNDWLIGVAASRRPPRSAWRRCSGPLRGSG